MITYANIEYLIHIRKILPKDDIYVSFREQKTAVKRLFDSDTYSIVWKTEERFSADVPRKNSYKTVNEVSL